jgi:hypothetical protein
VKSSYEQWGGRCCRAGGTATGERKLIRVSKLQARTETTGGPTDTLHIRAEYCLGCGTVATVQLSFWVRLGPPRFV